jgi:hypothetical protein
MPPVFGIAGLLPLLNDKLELENRDRDRQRMRGTPKAME